VRSFAKNVDGRIVSLKYSVTSDEFLSKLNFNSEGDRLSRTNTVGVKAKSGNIGMIAFPTMSVAKFELKSRIVDTFDLATESKAEIELKSSSPINTFMIHEEMDEELLLTRVYFVPSVLFDERSVRADVLTDFQSMVSEKLNSISLRDMSIS